MKNIETLRATHAVSLNSAREKRAADERRRIEMHQAADAAYAKAIEAADANLETAVAEAKTTIVKRLVAELDPLVKAFIANDERKTADAVRVKWRELQAEMLDATGEELSISHIGLSLAQAYPDPTKAGSRDIWVAERSGVLEACGEFARYASDPATSRDLLLKLESRLSIATQNAVSAPELFAARRSAASHGDIQIAIGAM